MLRSDFQFFSKEDNNQIVKKMLEEQKDKKLVGVMAFDTGQVYMAPLIPDNILILHTGKDSKSSYFAYQLKNTDSVYDLCEDDNFDKGGLANRRYEKKLSLDETGHVNQLMQQGFLPLAKGYKEKYDSYSFLYDYHLAPSLLLDKYTNAQSTKAGRNMRNSKWFAFEATYSKENLQWNVHFNSNLEQNPCCAFLRTSDRKALDDLEKNIEQQFKLLTQQSPEIKSESVDLIDPLKDEAPGAGNENPSPAPDSAYVSLRPC